MTQDDLLLLAHILARVRGIKLSTLSKLATAGSNRLLFERLAAGHGCSTQTVDRAAAWFAANWPRHLEWPAGIPRQGPPGARVNAPSP